MIHDIMICLLYSVHNTINEHEFSRLSVVKNMIKQGGNLILRLRKVEARLGQGLGQGWGKVGARLIKAGDLG